MFILTQIIEKLVEKIIIGPAKDSADEFGLRIEGDLSQVRSDLVDSER